MVQLAPRVFSLALVREHPPAYGLAPDGLPAGDDADVVEALGDEIATLASHIHAATHRLLVLLAEFDRRQGWVAEGHRSCAHWLAPLASGASLQIDALAPPQVEESRAFELARMQLSAFFYWITYDESTGRGGFWLGGFFPILSALRDDWGNPLFLGFMEAVADWEPRVLASAADDYFRVAIRRHPAEISWSWALEWNSNMRLVGFLGEESVVRRMVEGLPKLVVRDFPVTPTSGFRGLPHQKGSATPSGARHPVRSAGSRS